MKFPPEFFRLIYSKNDFIFALMKNRKQNRHPYWDYSVNGAYFMTICTQNREHFFGEIVDDKMQLNSVGEIAEKFWTEIPDHFPNIKLLDFVVMPNHLHGILWVMDNDLGNIGFGSPVGTNQWFVPTNPPKKPNRNMQTIPKIISQYKMTVTKNLRQKFGNYEFAWQRSFHDRIIRNDDELGKIRNYIQTNPERWYRDRNNAVGIFM